MQTINTVFTNEDTFQEIHGECWEKMPQATEAIKSSYEGMRDMFGKYLDAIEEWAFRHAYQCGYEAAMKAMQEGGAV